MFATLRHGRSQWRTTLLNRANALIPAALVVGALSGCSSVLNTADNADYGCPGMPLGVTCKTPAAVYKSTNGDVGETAFDQPIGADAQAKVEAPVAQSHGLASTRAATTAKPGPRPVREPARVARIWIAPWVDRNDNLHLAQTLYTEIKPRTWTVGKPEVAASSGYVIPHKAFESIESPVSVASNEREEKRPSVGNTPTVSSQASREVADLIAPPGN